MIDFSTRSGVEYVPRQARRRLVAHQIPIAGLFALPEHSQ